MTSAIKKKLARLRTPDTSPRVLDLFSGCGGFSLGFQRLGCEIIAGVELDPHAARSHALNFHGDLQDTNRDLFDLHATGRDITTLDPIDFLKELGHPTDAVDLLIGGPPCPAFARVGRAKLREIHEKPQAFKEDPRAKLYEPYLKFVAKLQPVALVMENVPDILNFGGHNLGEEICEVLKELGYQCAYTLLNAANYGVPQMRERFFLMAIHRDAGVAPIFPAPTFYVDFPAGYQGARNVALKHTNLTGLFTHFIQTPSQAGLNRNAHPATTISDAIADLPPITGHLTGEITRGSRKLDEGVQLNLSFPCSSYVETLRSWPAFGLNASPEEITGHVIRSLSFRDYRIFRRMQPGEEYPQAYSHALHLFEKRCDLFRDHFGLTFPEEAAISKRAQGHLEALLKGIRALQEDESADANSLVQAWEETRPDFKELDRLWWRYAGQLDAVRAVMKKSDTWHFLPDDAALKRDFQKQHALVLGWLRWIAAKKPVAIHERKKLDVLMQQFNQTLRYRRKKEAYANALKALARADHQSPVALGLEGDRPSSELKVKLKALSHRVQALLEEKPFKPLLLREQLLLTDLLVIHFSQKLNAWQELKADFVPPYDPMKFPNKWRKMEPDRPSRTLLAHLGKDSYTHIHFDNKQARTLSVREAARLQSFPDGFQFSGSMNPGFRQIGNAVPPLMSAALAEVMLNQIKSPAEPCSTNTQRQSTPQTPAQT